MELPRLRRIADLPAQAQVRMGGIEQRLNEGIAVKRRIIENLRPSSLDLLGLVSALEVMCQDAAIVSSPGQGTHIRAELPCKAQSEGESCETEETVARG